MQVYRVVAAALAACASLGAFAQVQALEVRKQIRYEQTSATDVTVRTDDNAYGFRANVYGNASISPPPSIAGPFNVGALGLRHNNGVLVYDSGSAVWRWGQSAIDFGTSSRSELDSLFPNGIYTFTVPGTSNPALSLDGDAYPAAPRVTFGGGAWAGGAYHIDPAQPLTVTTSAFAEWGTHSQHNICIHIKGAGFLPPGQDIVRRSDCLVYLNFRTNPTTNFASFTLPADRLVAGEEYTIVAAFVSIVDEDGLANARFVANTSVRIKTTTPVFPMVVTSSIDAVSATASAQIQYRPQDVGTLGSVFVFALAPATRVMGGQAAGVLKVGMAKDEKKADTPIACVLAQLNAAGQMVAVSSANLAAYLTGVLSAQGASVTILNVVPTGNVSGATFFVGYGASGTAMINGGVNRAAVTVPGSLTCVPSAPQTGWWWNPLEDGRGFSIEKRGNNLFFAAFLYDVSGRSTWHVSSGPVSLEGSLYNGDLLSASGGQTLGGAYSRFPTLGSAGSMTLTFNNDSTGTLVWAGGTVPIQRFNIVPNGLSLPAVPGQPESGWWWNEQEAGRGFFMEWQNGTLDIAGYMYDDNGNPVWYLTVGDIGGSAAARTFSGTWWSYGNGQTLTGPWRQNARTNSNVAPVTITFSGGDTALMTLPNGRTTSLKRHRF